jgi:hypothetical protein
MCTAASTTHNQSAGTEVDEERRAGTEVVEEHVAREIKRWESAAPTPGLRVSATSSP